MGRNSVAGDVLLKHAHTICKQITKQEQTKSNRWCRRKITSPHINKLLPKNKYFSINKNFLKKEFGTANEWHIAKPIAIRNVINPNHFMFTFRADK